MRFAVATVDTDVAKWITAGWTVQMITASSTYWFAVLRCEAP